MRVNTSNELLLNIINSMLEIKTDKSNNKVYLDDFELISLIKSIENDIENVKYLEDSLIEKIVSSSKAKNKDKFIIQIKSIRDLFIGKDKYKLNVSFKPKYIKDINTFLTMLRDYVESVESGLLENDKYIEELLNLKNKILNNELIINFSFIETIINDYNSLEYETNLYKVMEYISIHNLNILKTPNKILPVIETKEITSMENNPELLEVLKRIGINYDDLSSDLIKGILSCNHENMMNNYRLISKNKAENYGILHLIKKENYKTKLIILLYSNPETIKEVVDLTKDVNGKINVPLLKSICNNVASCFISTENEFYKPMFENFKKNMELLKSLEINYPSLIKNSPLFMISNSSDIAFALNHLENLGFNKKQIINRCYKTLSINPSLIVRNANIIKNKIVDLDLFIKESKNYILLKIDKLEDKINYLTEHDKETITYKCLTKNLEEYVINSLKNGGNL